MIPEVDCKIGISAYSTTFKGCGGRIRIHDRDFEVSEILSEKTLSTISQKGDFAVYKLQKYHIDTTHALEDIFKKHRLRLKSLGLKDASAVTEQYVSSVNKSKSISSISNNRYSLKRIGFLKKPLSKKSMIGNSFKIKISGALSNLSKFNDTNRILNFYGYQRFGSKRPVTHLIGKALLQRNFENAIDILLSYTSKYDLPENSELRKRLSDKSNYSKILQDMPPQMDLERIVVEEMIRHDNPIKAIRSLPLLMRRFFIQAYQSFLFNQTLSMAFNGGEELFEPQEGDVCYDKNGIIGKFANVQWQRLAIPFVGYSYYKKTRFHHYISKVLESEKISAKNFFVKEMQEISSEGGFRNSSIKCEDFSVSGNTLNFTLSRGSYATIILREIMKPEDPILAGF